MSAVIRVVALTRFITSTQSACEELPLLLSGEYSALPAVTNDLGTHDYSIPPAAVILGGGFSESEVAQVISACQQSNSAKATFLAVDKTKPAPPVGPRYGEEVVKRAKKAIAELSGNGRLRTLDELVRF